METEIPDLHELLSKVLSNRKITQLKCRNLVGKGENYGSLMLALDLIIENIDDKEQKQKLHLVAKVSPTSEFLKKMFNLPVTFKKEVLFYSQCLPALKEFQRRHSEKDSLKCFVNYYCSRMDLDPKKTEVGDNCCLVLENVKEKGFQNMDRMKGCNLRNAKRIFKDLAAFHAIPIAMKLKEPENFRGNLMPALKDNPYSKDSFSEDYESKSINGILNFLKEHKLFSHGETLQRLENILRENGRNFYNTDMKIEEPFATMIHYDFWTNNTMQKINQQGFIEDNLIVDMQTIKLGNPAHDLLLFLYTSVQTDVVKMHYDELLDYYFSEFIGNLYEMQVLDVTSFTREAFDKILVRAARFTGIFHVLFMINPICTIKEKAKEMSDITMENMESMDSVDFELYTEKIQRAIEDFLERKWF